MRRSGSICPGATRASWLRIDLANPTNDATGNLLPRRARTHGAVQVLQQAGPVQLGLEFIASSLRYDDAANTVKMGGYGIVNLTVEWPFAKGLVLARARQQRVQQELPAGRGLCDGRGDGVRQRALAAVMRMLVFGAGVGAWRRWSPPSPRRGSRGRWTMPATRDPRAACAADREPCAARDGTPVRGGRRSTGRRRRGPQRLAAGGSRACPVSATPTRSTWSASWRWRRIWSSRGPTRCRRSWPRCARAARRFSSAIPKSIAGIARDVEALGALADTAVTAQPAAAALRARYDALAARFRGAPAISVFYEIWNEPLQTIGGGHLISEAIALCGGRNIFAALTSPRPPYRSRPSSRPVRMPSSPAATMDDVPLGSTTGGAGATFQPFATTTCSSPTATCCIAPGPRFVDGVEALCGMLGDARANRAKVR